MTILSLIQFIWKVVMFYMMNLVMIISMHDLGHSINTKMESWILVVLIVVSFITQLLILGGT